MVARTPCCFDCRMFFEFFDDSLQFQLFIICKREIGVEFVDHWISIKDCCFDLHFVLFVDICMSMSHQLVLIAILMCTDCKLYRLEMTPGV